MDINCSIILCKARLRIPPLWLCCDSYGNLEQQGQFEGEFRLHSMVSLNFEVIGLYYKNYNLAS